MKKFYILLAGQILSFTKPALATEVSIHSNYGVIPSSDVRGEIVQSNIQIERPLSRALSVYGCFALHDYYTELKTSQSTLITGHEQNISAGLTYYTAADWLTRSKLFFDFSLGGGQGGWRLQNYESDSYRQRSINSSPSVHASVALGVKRHFNERLSLRATLKLVESKVFINQSDQGLVAAERFDGASLSLNTTSDQNDYFTENQQMRLRALGLGLSLGFSL